MKGHTYDSPLHGSVLAIKWAHKLAVSLYLISLVANGVVILEDIAFDDLLLILGDLDGVHLGHTHLKVT